MIRIVSFFLVLCLFGSRGRSQTNSLVDIPMIIQIFKTQSVEREIIDWVTFEEQVLEAAKVSRQEAIKTALTLNNNSHSFFIKGQDQVFGDHPEVYEKYQARKTCKNEETALFSDDRSIGYLRLNALGMNPNDGEAVNRKKARDYIDGLLQSIKEQDHDDLQAWIIDLRFNHGGNMWPMLIALTPFLEAGDLGYFVSGDTKNSWSVKEGVIHFGPYAQNSQYDYGVVDYQLKSNRAKIAVLIGDQTSSSGEATAITLKSIKRAAFIGNRTSGYATANQMIPLGEDEYLILTTSLMADHQEKTYPVGIEPDVEACGQEELLEALTSWKR